MFSKKPLNLSCQALARLLLLILSFQAPSYFVIPTYFVVQTYFFIPTYFVVPSEARNPLFSCQKIVKDESLAKRIKPFNNYNLEILPFPE